MFIPQYRIYMDTAYMVKNLIDWEITGPSGQASFVACNEHDMPVRLPYEYGFVHDSTVLIFSQRSFLEVVVVFFVSFCLFFLYVPGANNECRGSYLVKVQRIHDC